MVVSLRGFRENVSYYPAVASLMSTLPLIYCFKAEAATCEISAFPLQKDSVLR